MVIFLDHKRRSKREVGVSIEVNLITDVDHNTNKFRGNFYLNYEWIPTKEEIAEYLKSQNDPEYDGEDWEPGLNFADFP